MRGYGLEARGDVRGRKMIGAIELGCVTNSPLLSRPWRRRRSCGAPARPKTSSEGHTSPRLIVAVPDSLLEKDSD